MNSLLPIIILIWIVSAIIKGTKNVKELNDNKGLKEIRNFKDRKELRNGLDTRYTKNTNRNDSTDSFPKQEMNQSSRYLNSGSEANVPREQTMLDYGKRPDSKPARIAKRIYLGDVPPNGTRAVKCPYCNADNVVPINDSKDYHCYFCWVGLNS